MDCFKTPQLAFYTPANYILQAKLEKMSNRTDGIRNRNPLLTVQTRKNDINTYENDINTYKNDTNTYKNDIYTYKNDMK